MTAPAAPEWAGAGIGPHAGHPGDAGESGGAGESEEVVVGRCTVTVVRRGGWSWGPEPGALAGRVVDALPGVLAEHFAEYLAGDGPDVEITEPVVITVRPGRWPTTAATGMVVTPPGDPLPGGTSTGPRAGASADALAETFRESFGESFAESFPGPSAGSATHAPPEEAAVTLFAELAERGELGPLLALLPDDSVRAYLLALLGDADAASSPVAGRVFAELALRTDPARLARSLPDATLPSGDPEEVVASLAALFTGLVTRVGPGETARLVASMTGPPSESLDRPRPGQVRAGASGEARVWSALPFLLAGPLARVGLLDAIGPALAGLDLADDAPLLAAALAYKVLGVTERGWRRAERDTVAAAAFAGLAPPVPEGELTAAARRLRPALPVLDGVLALAVSRGHDAADPLLVTGAAGGLLLVDARGLFPVAWAEEASGLVPHWRACGRPPMLVCEGPLPPGCLRDLAEAGVPFVTALRPLRGDPVTRLPWRAPVWAAEGARVEPRLATELPGHAGRLGGLVRALVAERRAAPLAARDDLERTVTLAAGLGLATIAWMLWRDRETPDPVVALTRFADLDATVRFERDAVRVRVPLGRRHADLLRAGLLADVPGVVWLGGRTLTFSGG
ncbi:hypothetical protein Ssi03_22420 [Sphaerisporangium siamense]|uniref:Uncharacterized protein n=1 Tax=Sphaerisporangium siamense TaxID=795645 RepID=A0A7W7D9E6_9ACTN|nr:hypothetical protein [Sphaerisporangium siamense]MBB4701840.1 hypothetical protein [Sphaerisporangium siamense]GII84252.1 hypothetical protein Ssi03_22420 [Sphaerisporangium siamense]